MQRELRQLSSLNSPTEASRHTFHDGMVVAEREALESTVWRDGDQLEEQDGLLKDVPTEKAPLRYAKLRLFSSFMLFGLLNNVLYVIILSSALDLVSSSTPKGLIALFNIFPALIAKVLWPYLSNGPIRYQRRIYGCTAASWTGMVVIASFENLYMRLLGIAFASFSSGLGELTFLQMSATLPSAAWSQVAIGAWSTGTGGAGIAGAGLWWLLRGLGVPVGLGISSFLPLFFPFTLHFLLPAFDRLPAGDEASVQIPYQHLADTEDTSPYRVNSLETTAGISSTKLVFTYREKWALAKPLLLLYMLPLFAVYVEEYVINSGVAPTLVFPVPTAGFWTRVFKSPRDYYPFWSLTYQSFVFLSRSSLSLGLPALPKALLPLPAVTQFLVLLALSSQASSFLLSSPEYTPPQTPPTIGADRAITVVFLLICLEGTCGGLAYVNTFFHVGREGEGEHEETKARMEREFRIGVTGAADSCGILFASLISMPVEVALCGAQVAKGRSICRDL